MDFRQELDRNVPPEIQRAFVEMIRIEYRQTHAEVTRVYDKPESSVLEPHLRRANIEKGLLELQDRFPDLLRVGTGTTSSNHQFRFVFCGSIKFTQSYVEADRRVPREAVFRNEFAGDPNQYLLDPEADSERARALDEQGSIYAIITHTPSENDAGEPSQISVAFVDRDCKHVASIDLISKLAAESAERAPTEEVPDKSQVSLRKGVGKYDVGS